MNKTIRTYEDLLQEEQRLTAQLTSCKTLIQADITGIKAGVKEKLNPVKKVKETVRNLFIHDGKNGPALNFTINFVLDFIIRTFIPKRTSVWTKTIIPFLTKNYVANMITDDQRQTVSKVVNETIGKIDEFIRKTMIKKQEDHYRTTTPTPPPAPENIAVQ